MLRHFDLAEEMAKQKRIENERVVFLNGSNWERSFSIVDLANEAFKLVLERILEINELESLPQSIAVDSSTKRVYVSDVGLNVVHMFENYENKGEQNSQF